MIPSEKRKSAAFYLTAAVISMFCFAQTTHCLWLKKTVRRVEEEPTKAPVEATETQKGRIVFGRVFEREAAVKSQDVDGAEHTNAGDDTIYQADQPGHERDAPAKVAREAWRNMFPNLECTRDHMKFRAVGSGAPHVNVEQGNGTPLPLFQVPSTCGYNVHRNAFVLVMSVPYNGCYVTQEAGSYVLPLHWLGAPVSLLCPKLNPPQDSSMATPSTTTLPPPPPREPEIPQYSQFQILPILSPNSSPVSQAASPLSGKTQHIPHPFFLTNSAGNSAFPQPFPYYFQTNQGFSLLPPATTAAPVATTTLPADTTQSKPPPADPVAQMYQFPFPPYSNANPWQLHNPQATVQFPFPVYHPYSIPMPPYNFPPAAQPQLASQMPSATVKKDVATIAPSSYVMHPQWHLFQMPLGQSQVRFVKSHRNA